MEKEVHRKTAVDCFNSAWTYLGSKKRREEDDQSMLNLAHASRFHWSLVGTSRNQAVGDWQISRIYAALGQAALSLQFAKSSLEICERDRLGEILCTAYEAMARAFAVGGELEQASKYLAKASEALDVSRVEDEDREVYLGQILETEEMIRNLRP